ncbi:MAG: hypothetical protein WCL50_15650 [Spirochaetota bacterium]
MRLPFVKPGKKMSPEKTKRLRSLLFSFLGSLLVVVLFQFLVLDPVAEEIEKVKRLIKYSVDRWGAYADIWELLNEQKADTAWFQAVVPYLKSIDPYGKPISTSWERPEIAGIDINSPHSYKSEPDVESDRLVAGWASSFKKRGKLVLFGEQGNTTHGPIDRRTGCGGVWDPLSAQRMRVRLWTALFSEIGLVFWDTSYAKDGNKMNIWLGPDERAYVHVLQTFAQKLDKDVKMAAPNLDGAMAGDVRAYGLRSSHVTAVYLHHTACAQCAKEGKDPVKEHVWQNGPAFYFHDPGEVKDVSVTLDVPKGHGYWVSPVDGALVGRVELAQGKQTVPVPPFKVDMALLVSPDAPLQVMPLQE